MPLILSTWSFGQRGNDAAWPALAAGGSSLDAVETVARAVERDVEVDSVGIGGLPDAEGRMTLDASIMLGPDRSGSVCAIERHLHVVSIARRVMERTDHTMLAGAGADRFAESEGFTPEPLLSDESRAAWEAWRRDPTPVDQSRDRGAAAMRPVDRGDGGRLFDTPEMSGHDTIGALAIDEAGVLAGSCSTSGTPYKLPGRVGDSPVIGHGLYVEPAHGGAVASGSGELISGLCATFLAVECMRRGASPRDAIAEVLGRVATAYDVRDHHQVVLIAVAPDGAWSGGSLRDGFRVAVRTPRASEVVEPQFVLAV